MEATSICGPVPRRSDRRNRRAGQRTARSRRQLPFTDPTSPGLVELRQDPLSPFADMVGKAVSLLPDRATTYIVGRTTTTEVTQRRGPVSVDRPAALKTSVRQTRRPTFS